MWIKWLEDERVGFKSTQAEKYMKIARELGDQIPTSSVNLNLLSVNKLYSLASAPEEVKEFNIVVRDGHLMNIS